MGTEGQRREVLAAELQALFAKAKLPTNPALASQILALANDPTSTAEDLGTLVRTDPALATRILGAANSVYNAQRTPVATIERAIAVLGLNHLKTAALSFQLVAHLDRLGGVPFDMKAFWQQSLARACFCQAAARNIVPDLEEEAFLIGLLQDIGVLLLVQVLGGGYADLYSKNLSPTAFFSVEKGAFSHTHTDAIAVMCRQWNLPALICKPLEQHHQRPMLTGERSPEDLLWAVSYLAGGVRFSAELAVDPEEDEIRQFAVEALGLQAAALARIRQDAADEYRAISAVFREVLPEGLDIADLLNEANRQLTTAALAAGQRVLDVEQAQSQILGERRQLRKALREYRERAALDPLTHVLNRGAIADALLEAARANLDAGTTAGVLFIDVDDFKSLNDRYGQQAGDSVLRAVAMSLSRHDWPNGIVGRFGGEEFIVLLHDVTEEACRQAGVRAVELIRALKSNELPPDARFTCSVGAAWTDDFRRNTPEQTVAFADQLMSRAKQAGKDRSCFSAMPSAEAPPTAGGSATTSSPALPATLAEQPYNAGITAEVLLRLARQLNTSNSGDSVSLRRRQRNNMVAACVCSYFPNESSTIKKCHAATRNISTAGIGLLSPFPFVRGEPIEIFLPHAEARMYFAGLVAFCRHILGGVYEVGVQLVSHGRAPTFSADSAAALAKRDWAALALAQKFGKPLQSVLV